MAATVTTPGKAFKNGVHIGPGPWLNLILAMNDIEPDTFGDPVIDTGTGRYIEVYASGFTVDLGPVGDKGDSPVTITAHTTEGIWLLEQAVARINNQAWVTTPIEVKEAG